MGVSVPGTLLYSDFKQAEQAEDCMWQEGCDLVACAAEERRWPSRLCFHVTEALSPVSKVIDCLIPSFIPTEVPKVINWKPSWQGSCTYLPYRKCMQ